MVYVPYAGTTGSRAEAAFRSAAERLPDTQAAVLTRFLDGARQSEFAKLYGLTNVRTVKEFQDAVPIAPYEAFAPYIDRLMQGESKLLFDAEVEAFIQTGGTSGRSKILLRRPLRNSELAAKMIDVGFSHALRLKDHPELAGGLGFYLLGAAPPGKVPFGGTQMYAAAHTASAAFRKGVFVDPVWYEVLEDAPTRFYVLARLSAGVDIRFILGLSDALFVLLDTLRADGERIVRDVHDGTVSVELSPRALEVLPRPPPDPALASALTKAIQTDGTLTPRALWPNFALALTQMSAALGQSRRLLSSGYGVPLRELGLSSTETPNLTFPVRDEDTNLVFGVHTAFCEFVDPAGTPRLAHELTQGPAYRVVVTTPDGLFRYDTRDQVQLTGWEFGGSPVLQFVGRARAWSLLGEQLSEHQVRAALAHAAEEARGAPRSVVLIPHPPADSASAHYELVADRGDEALDASRYAAALEDALVRANSLYEHKRALGVLAASRVTWVDAAWFAALRAWLEQGSASAKLPVFLPRERLTRALAAGLES